jgi:peptidoglycan hydrolase-like protein with peptidoglycan-binding domain
MIQYLAPSARECPLVAFVHQRPVTSLLQALRPALRTWAALLVALATVLAVGLAGGSPASAATLIPDPVSPKAVPAVPDGFAPYVPQDSCDPTIKPGTAALRTLLMTTYGGRDLGITRACDIGTTSEHKEGRAFDWGLNAAVPAEKAIATQFLTWLLAPGPNGMVGLNARRLGVMYVIWNGKIWGGYRAAEGWRTYTGGESHSDHIHISLSWNGAMKKTSWWTGTTAPTDYGPCVAVAGTTAPVWTAPRTTPCPAPIDPMTLTGTPLLAQGMTSPYAVQLQRLLHVTPVTGYFGPLTDAALRSFQAARGLPVTATTTPATWTALRSATTVVTPPASDGQTVTAARSFPSAFPYRVRTGDTLSGLATKWRSTVSAIVSASRLTSTTLRTGQVITIPVRSGITKFTYTTLHVGSSGVAVKALQSALEMRKKYRTGFFGPITQRKVNALKVAHHWKADGLAGPNVWRALGA